MKRLALLIMLAAAPAAHAGNRLSDSLLKVEPKTRLEQVCDLEAMHRIQRDTKMRADRAKSDVISSPQHAAHTLTANGGAFRAGGKWYRLSFVCSGSPDHLRVLSFSYKIGEEIPEARWNDLGLWR